MFGINGGELIILLVVIAIVAGPERLPGYAEQLGKRARELRNVAQNARRRVDDELGDAGLDWEALDPRRYDPRRIIREALGEDLSPLKAAPGPATPSRVAASGSTQGVPVAADQPLADGLGGAASTSTEP